MKFTILLKSEDDSSAPLMVSQIELLSALPRARHILDWYHLVRQEVA